MTCLKPASFPASRVALDCMGSKEAGTVTTVESTDSPPPSLDKGEQLAKDVRREVLRCHQLAEGAHAERLVGTHFHLEPEEDVERIFPKVFIRLVTHDDGVLANPDN